VIVYVPPGVFFVPCCPLEVVKFKVEDALPAPGTTDAGENAQLAPVGNPLQVRETEVAKLPPSPVTAAV